MRHFGKAGVFAFALSALSLAAYGAGTSSGAVQSDQPAAGGATSPSTTGSAERSRWGSFSSVDKNGDGFLDQNEAAAVPGLSFMSYDADGDQRLSEQEYEAARSGAPALQGEGSGGSPVAPGQRGPDQKGSGGYPER